MGNGNGEWKLGNGNWGRNNEIASLVYEKVY